MNTKLLKRGLLVGLLIFSIGSLLFAPLESVIGRLKETLPWVAMGIILTELLFIAGLVIMATALGLRISNPVKLRKRIKDVLRQAVNTPIFWVGFWINAVGACGSSILICVGIIRALPLTSWGLLYLPLVDVLATITIRRWALRAFARGGNQPLS